MFEQKHVSVHIEKTGGTSIIPILSALYRPDQVLLMNPGTGLFYRANEGISRSKIIMDELKFLLGKTPLYPLIARINRSIKGQNPGNITFDQISNTDFKAVQGHFNADYFDGVLANPILTVILRDPLDRIKSHYFHWIRTGGNLLQRLDLPVYHGEPFDEFAFFPQLQNLQTKTLGGHTLSDFDAVGVTENLEAFVNKILNILDIKSTVPPRIRKLNRNPRTVNNYALGINEDFKNRFTDFHALDYENYEKAKLLLKSY